MRLNKYLSESGACSRREADTYIAEGRVTVNGEATAAGTGGTVPVRALPARIVFAP